LGEIVPEAISVVVVNWNRRELLRACLRSLQYQTDQNFEVVLVDNASEDGSAEMAQEEFSETLRLRLVRNDKNLGFCGGNNRGIAASRSEYVALLNNDAEAHPDWLREMRATIHRDQRCGMVASRILNWANRSIIDKAGHLIWLDGQNRGRGSGARDAGQFDGEEEALWPDGCACLYRRAMLDDIGGFDEDLFAYADDAELGLRARKAAWGCRYNGRAIAWHHRGQSMGVTSLERIFLIERNRLLLALRHFPWSLLLLNPWYFSLRLLAGLRASLRGEGEAGQFSDNRSRMALAFTLLRANFAALRMAPAFLRKRNRSPRRISNAELIGLLRRFRISLQELSNKAAHNA
jgi:GT2 family glycosyltransferase